MLHQLKTPNKRKLEDELVLAQIRHLEEQTIERRIENKRARLQLALEAHDAATICGVHTDVIE